MYTGTLINDLLALVDRAEHSARAGVATEETRFLFGAPAWQEDVRNQPGANYEVRLTDQTVPEAAWSERG